VDGEQKRSGNWMPDGSVERVIARREYKETTPGQRVEQAITLSAQLTRLAVRGRERAQGERA
jgi:hypothetical protein